MFGHAVGSNTQGPLPRVLPPSRGRRDPCSQGSGLVGLSFVMAPLKLIVVLDQTLILAHTQRHDTYPPSGLGQNEFLRDQ